MIHFTKDLFKFKKFKDLDRLIRKHEIDEVEGQEELIKLLAKGKDIYCCLAPNELDNPDNKKNILMWKEDEHRLLDLYWTLTDEI